MNKLTKLLFSVISSVAIATSAFAGEFTVSGSAKNNLHCIRKYRNIWYAWNW